MNAKMVLELRRRGVSIRSIVNRLDGSSKEVRAIIDAAENRHKKILLIEVGLIITRISGVMVCLCFLARSI